MTLMKLYRHLVMLQVLTCASVVLFIIAFLVARKAHVSHQWKVFIYIVLSVVSICNQFFSIIVLLFWIG